MKNDKKIEEAMKKLIHDAENWYNWVTIVNHDAKTDRQLEDILKQAKNIEKMYKEE